MHSRSLRLALGGMLGVAALFAVVPAVPAINITVQYDATQPGAVMPAFDPNGTQLLAIANYAASFYEDVFEDAGHSSTLTFWYTDLPDNQLGNHDNITDDANMRESVGTIRIDTQSTAGTARNYFYDPTPANNNEYAMAQALWRNVSLANRGDWFAGPAGVPATFETSFTGTAPAGSAAVGTLDMLSLIFHEMGHSLGMAGGIPLTVTETTDGDYDFNSAWIFGGTLAADNVDQATDFVGHLDDPSALMAPSLGIPGSGGSAGVRKLPSHVDLFSMAAGHNYTTLDVPRREFYNPSGNWNTNANWSGNNTPDNGDDTFVRNGSTATLSGFGAAGNLNVLEGALVSTQTNTLFVQNSTTVAGAVGNESQITINTDGELDSDTLNINNGGRVVLVGATSVLQSERINIASDGELRGRGTIDLNDNLFGLLTSEGLIRATAAGELLITSQNGLGLDLAGGTIEAIDGNIRFETGMTSAMQADVDVGPGRQVAFNGGGSSGAGSLINLVGTSANPATMSGSIFFVGLNAVINADGLGVIQNSLVLQPSSIVSTEFGDASSEIRLAGATTFQGGRLLGDGVARQIGNAVIQQDTEISINTYDMDGISGNTIITVNSERTLEITSAHIDTTAENDFDGTLHVNSGTLDIASAWRLDGSLNLSQTTGTHTVLRGAGGVTVVGGGGIGITGAADVETSVQVDNGKIFVDGNAEFSGTTTLGNNAEVEINDASDSLRLMGQTHLISPSIIGNGRLVFDGDVNVAFLNTSIGIAETDLDGLLGDTEIVINQGLTLSIASITIEPTANDGFDGLITNRGTFSVVAGWRLDGDLEIEQIGATVPSLAGLGTFRIHTTGTYSTDGDSNINPPLEVAGAMVIGGGVTHVNNTAAFEPTANVTVGTGAELELNGPTTFEGGAYTGAGLIQLNGTALVETNTTIATGRIDLDGAAEDTQVVLKDTALVLNVAGVDVSNSSFDGTLDATGPNARLEVNLSNPLATWRIGSSGIANLATSAPIGSPSLMLDGSDVSVDGRINATGRIRFGANVALAGRLQLNTSATDVHFGGGGLNLIHNTAIVDGSGSITIDNGTQMMLEHNSNVGVDVENIGRLEIGFSPTEVGLDLTQAGAATIRGNFAQGSQASFGVELAGLVQGSEFDVLNVTGVARLAGELEVELIDGFAPAIGNKFQILTASGVAGTFDSVVAFDAADLYNLDVSVLYSAIDAVVQIDDLQLIGDYNRNGEVDAPDYVLWRDTLGEIGMDLAADGNGDGEIGQDDYGVWRARFGNTVGMGAAAQLSATVPEPHAFSLFALAGILALAWRAKRCSVKHSQHCQRRSRFERLENRSLLANSPVLVGAHLFYNNSSFDGNEPVPDESDAAAIATDKSWLLPGETASFTRYSTYDKGINGLAIDLRNLGLLITAPDLSFKAGTTANPGTWAPAPEPTRLLLRHGAGAGGSDRVTVEWADGVLKNTWLQVTVEATGNVFYFGNVVGETGNSTANTFVSAADEIGVREHFTPAGQSASIENVHDFNRDGLVDSADGLIARNNRRLLGGALPLITAPDVAALNLVVSSDSPTVGLAGEVIHYAYEIHNTGNVELTNITVEAGLGTPAARQADVVGDNDTMFEGGEVWRFTGSSMVSQFQLNAGVSITNTATVDSVETGPDTDNTVSTIASLQGDVFGNVTIRPITHASFVMSYNGKTIYVDPDGAASLYAGIPKADYILLTHSHSDHFDPATIAAVMGPNVKIVAPQAVFNSMTATLRNLTMVIDYSDTTPAPNALDFFDELNNLVFNVKAVHAYNANHALGFGNGYIVTIDQKRIYIAGDTGAQPELRALEDIDIAFLCMNSPFTMTPADAVSLVRDMKPLVVYPYHYRNQDGTLGNAINFKNLMSTDFSIEVRLRKWY